MAGVQMWSAWERSFFHFSMKYNPDRTHDGMGISHIIYDLTLLS